jgi:hypothetical protein
LATATLKLIPASRSFLYGLFIRRVAFHSHSLEALVVAQVFLSTVASVLLFYLLAEIFRVRFVIAAMFAVLSAVEPLGLLMERYVMTESCANFLFAVYLVLLLVYVKNGELWPLLVGQAVGVLLIGIRISFLPIVLTNSLLIPLLSPRLLSRVRDIWRARSGPARPAQAEVLPHPRAAVWTVAAHLVLSLVVSQGLIAGYKRWYGHLEHREPALLYENGAFLISDFAPLVERQDLPAGVPDTVLSDLTMDRHDFGTRPGQHFATGGLVWSVGKAFPDAKRQNDVEVEIAVHALIRQPLGALHLAWRTFLSYFDNDKLTDALLIDEGRGQPLPPKDVEWLEHLYGVPNPRAFEPSVTKRWHVAAAPWYRFVLVSLCVSPLFWFLTDRENRSAMLVCIVCALVFLEGATLTVDRATPRFLTTDAWLVLLLWGVAANAGVNSLKQIGFRRPSIPV